MQQSATVLREEFRQRTSFLPLALCWRLAKVAASVLLAFLSLGAAAAQEPAKDLHVTRDVPYRHLPSVAPRFVSLDIYAPASADGTNPVILFLHGGAFVVGDKAGNPREFPRPGLLFPKMPYYAGQGFVFVSANYRLSKRSLPLRHPRQVAHPDHIDDVVSAVAWVRRHIGRYGGDPQKLILMGHSSGALLVALAAVDTKRLRRQGLDPVNLRGVIALDGFYDIPARIPYSRPFIATALGGHKAAWRDASPLHHVRPGRHVPPILLVHTDRQRRRQSTKQQSLAFARALSKTGHRAATYQAVGKTHRDINHDLGTPGDPLTLRVDSFLDSVLKDSKRIHP
jgi:acetyl esterase/lipase